MDTKITVYGQHGNEWTDRVLEALDKIGIQYTLMDKFEWSQNLLGKWERSYISVDNTAHIRFMPSIRIEGDEEEILKWIIDSPLGDRHDFTSKKWISHKGCREAWISGYDECMLLIDSVNWSKVP